MGGCAVADDCEVTTNETRTLVLLGRTGNGKSATGNSILGRKAFMSKHSSCGVTSTCELESTRLDDGLTIDVIDTPGLFDFSGDPEYIGKEIVKCMELAKDGIHAVILVLSVRTRFTSEEHAAIQTFQEFFGEKIRDYMVVVFTGGDELEDSDQSLDEYLGNGCPEPLKETIKMCDNRVVLFDNKTKDPNKKVNQLKEFLLLVNLVLEKNDGVPYTIAVFQELKALKVSLSGDSNHVINELKGPILTSYEEQLAQLTENTKDSKKIIDQRNELLSLVTLVLEKKGGVPYTNELFQEIKALKRVVNEPKSYEYFKQLTEIVILKMTDITHKYLEQWATERADRLIAEKTANAAQAKSEFEMRELQEKFERLKLKSMQQAKGGCYIL